MAEGPPTSEQESESSRMERNANGKESSGLLRTGKYFLILVVLAVQLAGAWFLVDRYYEPVQAWIQEVRRGDPIFYKMEQMVVNPADTNGQRYLMVEISLELENGAALQRLEEQKYRLRHTIRETLTRRTVDQLVQSDERERMRSEITRTINELTGSASVRNLYYSKYVMQ